MEDDQALTPDAHVSGMSVAARAQGGRGGSLTSVLSSGDDFP